MFSLVSLRRRQRRAIRRTCVAKVFQTSNALECIKEFENERQSKIRNPRQSRPTLPLISGVHPRHRYTSHIRFKAANLSNQASPKAGMSHATSPIRKAMKPYQLSLSKEAFELPCPAKTAARETSYWTETRMEGGVDRKQNERAKKGGGAV
jgi:hypothetical protein